MTFTYGFRTIFRLVVVVVIIVVVVDVVAVVLVDVVVLLVVGISLVFLFHPQFQPDFVVVLSGVVVVLSHPPFGFQVVGVEV